jgi:hypothetical protein
LLILVELIELSDQVDECSFAERVVEMSLEGKSWELLGKVLNPSGSEPSRNEIAFIQDEYEMLMRAVLLDVLLKVVTSGSDWIPGIDDHAQDIRSIDYLI